MDLQKEPTIGTDINRSGSQDTFYYQEVDQKLVGFAEIQFGFMPGFATTNNIVILRQLQRKYLAKKGEFVIFLYRFGESF